ncbi:MAG: energy-coupling factor transporter ATPase [Oscillospiraceae bacterium]|jgi:energy-coupling factor transport system ATP-binding protein|nr:energy-coupling factor transporter ATPase [Oscillospiraceae bacterium]
MKNIIKTEKLEFTYIASDDAPSRHILNKLNLEIEKGTFVAIIGHNGSGKTTLAKHFNAILLPTGGRVLVNGMDTIDESLVIEIRRRVGMVFQNPDNQIVATVVEEDVAFAPENLGYPPAEIRERVDEALKIVGMYEFREHAPHLLSGGQKQRIAIAGVLAMRPECIVFDEPTAMLDPQGREKVINIMRDLRDNHGVTVVLITHHMDEAVGADRLIVMSDGEIYLDGTPREVFKQTEKLQETGLSIPETAQLLNKLKHDGFDVLQNALTIDECVETIYEAVSADGRMPPLQVKECVETIYGAVSADGRIPPLQVKE